ncbi:Monodehydroascorbate/ferredoxin reductase [Ceraceosorus bombacis]|uniref:Monodehydroascorbate/ferredoxin reductase n=1 Tax=Ceraceosorus bombacis TaxID=401625 RepID=A0A0P1BFD9_9BASI|nr:Monodehydroascorbate/ferredoxin reductase [Ceraceosorus bombacis]
MISPITEGTSRPEQAIKPSLLVGPSSTPLRWIKRSVNHDCKSDRAAQHSEEVWRGMELDDGQAKNVLVLGGSYGGMHAASVLAQKLPPSHRVILIERNSHFNHLYVFPRFSVMPGKEHAAFIPYSSLFDAAPARPSVRDRWSSEHQQKRQAHAATSRDPHGPTGDGAALLGFERNPLGGRDQATQRHANAAAQQAGVASTQWRDSDEPILQAQRTSTPTSDRSSRATITASDSASTRSSPDTVATSVDRNEESDIEEGPQVQIRKLNERGEVEQQAETLVTECDVSQEFRQSHAHQVLQASVVSITDSHVVVQPASPASNAARDGEQPTAKPLWQIDQRSIPYTHLIYALGSHLPDPLRTPARTKLQGRSWLQAMQRRVAQAHDIVIVGGGALGVEYATDIASLYTGKEAKNVTLIHSRKQLLPSFDSRVHEAAYERILELGVNVVLGERLATSEGCPRGSTSNAQQQSLAQDSVGGGATCEGAPAGEGPAAASSGMCLGAGRKLIRTTTGRVLEADLLLLCTGQQPSSQILAEFSPTSVDPTSRLIRVTPHLRVARPADAAPGPVEPINPCGDCDCFVDGKAHTVDKHGNLSAAAQVDADKEAIHNVYAIGDCADAFGALNAGYQAWAMADVAAENILRSIEHSSGSSASTTANSASDTQRWQSFTPAPTMLKLSLGLGKMVFQGAPAADLETGEMRPTIEIKDDPHDLAVEGVWGMAGHHTRDLYL